MASGQLCCRPVSGKCSKNVTVQIMICCFHDFITCVHVTFRSTLIGARQQGAAGMAAVIALAQAKGGVGKTTAAVGLALELAERGYQVRLVDCDTNHHSAEFGMVNQMPKLAVIPALNPDLSPSDHGQPQITEKNLYAEIARSEREGAEVI